MKSMQQLYRADQSLNRSATPKGEYDDWAARPV
jgi:hypothetical protein